MTIRLSSLILRSAWKQKSERLAPQDGCSSVDKRIKGFQTELLYELWKRDVIQTADVPRKRQRYAALDSGEEKSRDLSEVFNFLRNTRISVIFAFE